MLRFALVAAIGGFVVAGANTLQRDVPAAPRAEVATNQLRGLSLDVGDHQSPASDAAVVKSADGHYWAEGLVNGKRVRFLVDTGASAVALTRTDAERLGVASDLDYSVEVSTANGVARAAPVMLEMVSVAGARVPGVQAFVIDKGLDHSLLGMSYLGRLSRFEATQNALILRP
jgi:aspartyl protease family protein